MDRGQRVGAAGHRAGRTAGAGRVGCAGGGLSRFALGQVVMPELSTSLLNSICANLASSAAPNTFYVPALRSLYRLWRRSGAALALRVALGAVSTLWAVCSGVKICTFATCNVSRCAGDLHKISKVSSSATNAAREPQQSLRTLHNHNSGRNRAHSTTN